MNFKGLLVFLILVAAGAVAVLALPAPRDVAPSSGFDTELAMTHLRFIASEPRQVGSEHHRAVREYLVQQLQSLGYSVEVQDTKASHPRLLNRLPVQVMNVIATRPGTAAAGSAVMLAAHYDSTRVSAAPGAADDGAAVAALLEVARVLADEPLANDLIILITDAEELGLLGARAFVAEHPLAKRVGVVFNFEARGTSGPSIMFQTSRGNARLIQHYARVAPHPVTSSLAGAVYELMPNSTDFTIFRAAGMRGMDFAFIGDYVNYHTENDSVENLDVRSLRHHGVQALALARHFGNLDLDTLDTPRDAVYFSLPWLGVVHYPAPWAVALAAGAALLGFVAIVFAAQRGQVTTAGLLAGTVALALAIAGVAGVAYLLVRHFTTQTLAEHESLAIGGFALVALAGTSAAGWILDRRFDSHSFFAAGLIVWIILGLLVAGYVPGGSYLLAIPAIFGGLALIVATPLDAHRELSPLRAVLLALLGVPLVLLIVPVTYLAFLALRLDSAMLMSSAIVLILWQLMPQLRLISPRGWALPLLAAAGAGACFFLIAR